MKRLCLALACLLALSCLPFSAHAKEEKQSIGEYLTDQYLLLEFMGGEGEMEAFHEMERHISGGNVTYDMQSLYIFYSDYLRLLVRHEETDAARPAVERYLARTEETIYAQDIADLSLEGSVSLTPIPEYYCSLMGYSTRCDDLFIGALERYADYLDGYAEKSNPQSDPLYEYMVMDYATMALSVRFQALSLGGQKAEAVSLVEDSLALYADDPMMEELVRLNFAASMALLQANPQEAAAHQKALLEYTMELIPDTSEQELYEYDMDSLYRYMVRGIVSQADCLAYVQALPKGLSFSIESLTDIGHKSGLMAGDVLLLLDDVPIFSTQQLQMTLATPTESLAFTLLRDGVEQTLSISPQNRRYGLTESVTLVSR